MRGKHKKRAEKLRVERESSAKHLLLEKIQQEKFQVQAMESLLEEMDRLTTEALTLGEELRGRESDESKRLRAEIGQLIRDVVELTNLEKRGRRARDRRSEIPFILHDPEMAEKFLAEHDSSFEGSTLTLGVHVKPGMSDEAIRRIQRARRIRK